MTALTSAGVRGDITSKQLMDIAAEARAETLKLYRGEETDYSHMLSVVDAEIAKQVDDENAIKQGFPNA